MKTKIVALIPLREGSKSIPLKNIKIMAGRPLCYWTIKAANDCRKISRVFVSTESPKIKALVNSFGFKKVVVIDRPPELATDKATTESVMHHAADIINFDVMITLQATSPLTQSCDLKKAILNFKKNNYDSLLSAVGIKRFFWGRDNKPLNYDPFKRPRRQDFKGTLMENGAFYITKKEALVQYSNRLGGNIGIYEMGPEHSAEIDEIDDWQRAEKLLLAREIKPKIKEVELIVTDFDGVLTNNMVEIDQTGKESVACNRSDGLAVGLLKKRGRKVICLSTEKNKVVGHRCRKMGIPVYQGIDDKISVLKRYLKRNKINKKQCMYIGNDINDLDCLQYVGCPVIPSNAADYLKGFNFYITVAKGGEGILREIYKLICE